MWDTLTLTSFTVVCCHSTENTLSDGLTNPESDRVERTIQMIITFEVQNNCDLNEFQRDLGWKPFKNLNLGPHSASTDRSQPNKHPQWEYDKVYPSNRDIATGEQDTEHCGDPTKQPRSSTNRGQEGEKSDEWVIYHFFKTGRLHVDPDLPKLEHCTKKLYYETRGNFTLGSR